MRVLWSESAKTSLADVLDYTLEHFGPRQVTVLTRQIKSTIAKIETFPESSPIEYLLKDAPFQYRSALVIKQIKIVYRLEGDAIYITFVWNVLQSPKNVLSKL